MATVSTSRALRPAQWSSQVLDCMSDMDVCCLGFWCTPCLYGAVASKALERDNWPCCAALGLAFYSLLAVPAALSTLILGIPVPGNVAGAAAAASLGACTRQRLRERYNLPQDECNDLCIYLWCTSCAVCQEAREIKARTVDGPPPFCMPWNRPKAPVRQQEIPTTAPLEQSMQRPLMAGVALVEEEEAAVGAK